METCLTLPFSSNFWKLGWLGWRILSLPPKVWVLGNYSPLIMDINRWREKIKTDDAILRTLISLTRTEHWNSSGKRKTQVLGLGGVIREQSRKQLHLLPWSLIYWRSVSSQEQTRTCGSSGPLLWCGIREAHVLWVGRNPVVSRFACVNHTW